MNVEMTLIASEREYEEHELLSQQLAELDIHAGES